MKKTLLILGAGTGGTMTANRMAQMLDLREWRIVIVDRDEMHVYQPGLLYVPFGMYSPQEIVRPRRYTLPDSVELICSDIDALDTANRTVRLGRAARTIPYDHLVIATGADMHPEHTPGLTDGADWAANIHTFYSLSGASALAEALSGFQGGRIVVNVADLPIKCPSAPFEFLMLADWYFRQRRLRSKVELVLATPANETFSEADNRETTSYLLAKKGITLETQFQIARADSSAQRIVSTRLASIEYELLVSIPAHYGAAFVADAQLGDDHRFVEVDPHTLQALNDDNIWVIGDAASLPAAKVASAVYFELDTLTRNINRAIHGEAPRPTFDGHAFMIDSRTDPGIQVADDPVGAPSLFGPTRTNQLGKQTLRWLYWNVLLAGRELPAGTALNLSQARVRSGRRGQGLS